MKYNLYSKRLQREDYENEWLNKAQYVAIVKVTSVSS